MTDELELEHRLLGIHRFDRELLGPDDLRFFGHLESFVGCLPAGTSAPASLLSVTRDLSLELVDEPVDRGAHVLRALARAQNRALRPHRLLGYVGLANRWVLLRRELQLDLGIGQLPLELGEPLLGIRADRFRDLDPAALHAKLRPSNLPNNPCKSHDLDPARSRLPQSGGGGVGGRAAREDVVDQHDRARHYGLRDERAGDIAAPFRAGEPALSLRRPAAAKQSLDRQLPAACELLSQLAGWMMATPQSAIRVGGDKRDHARARR